MDNDIVDRAAVTSYAAPAVEAVEIIGTYKPRASASGGDVIRVRGSNFGPRGERGDAPLRRGDEATRRMAPARDCGVLSHVSAVPLIEGRRRGPEVQVRDIGEPGCGVGVSVHRGTQRREGNLLRRAPGPRR